MLNNWRWNRQFRATVAVGAMMLMANLGMAAEAKPEGAGGDLAPLPLELPMPAFVGTPADFVMTEHIEKPSDKPRPPFLAPKGVKNVAVGKKVTLSDPNPIFGTAELVTDGEKGAYDENVLEMRRRTQWVQIDLGASYKIHAIVLWHSHNMPQVVHDVIVQVADDPDFIENVRVVYNNDYDNSSGLGVGKDKEYFESYEGRLIDAKGVAARYVRCHTRGSTYTALNRFTEVEVYGLPAQ